VIRSCAGYGALNTFGGRVIDLAVLQGETALASREKATAISKARSPNRSPNRSPRGPQPDDPAYVIYTSGPTGKPKGVVLPHRSVANFLRAMRELLQPDRNDRFLALTTLGFDIAVLELWLPLACGARTVIVPRAIARDGNALRDWIERFEPTVMQ